MIARIARWGAMIMVVSLAILSMQVAALAAADTPAPLTLDKAFTAATGKMATDEPSSIRDCARFPEGRKTEVDGWHFDQPVAAGSPLAYVIGFIDTVNGKANSTLIGVIAGQLYRIDVNERTMAGEFGPQDLLPVPGGVGGGLTGDGAWLTTPRGWRLASGALMVAGGTAGGKTTFALTAVCLPSPPASPAPKTAAPPASPAPKTATRSPAATTSRPVTRSLPAPAGPAPAATGMLPITGAGTGMIALLGLGAVAGGLSLAMVRRRRDRVRFRA